MTLHQFDSATGCCLGCGAKVSDVVTGVRPRECQQGETVVPISHLLSRKKFGKASAYEVMGRAFLPEGWT